jgi:phosphoenolpyruvate synthase/pyruvate phosphate dikinase
VGGKNASLGEMIGALKKEGIGVPDGFATTAEAYWKFLEANDLRERLKSQLDDLNSRNKPLHEVGRAIRSRFLHAEFPEDIARDIREAYRELCRRSGTGEVDVAVRSSATAEDLPEASFSGQQESFLNVTGEAIAVGEVCLIRSVQDISQFRDGAILVTEMTDPDWVPVMKRAAGIVTDHGGRTCHAAIVSRELGIPAIVGTGKATEVLRDGQEVTMSCAEGNQAYIYEGILPFEEIEVNLEGIPPTKTRIILNIASPAAAFRWWRLPCEGIGLARMEFIINNIIKVHPMALVRFDDLQDKQVRRRIEELPRGYADKTEYFVDHLARGIAKIAASQYPEPAVVRLSDFKTNEYAFCRTLKEADRVLATMAEYGLKRGENGVDRQSSPVRRQGGHLRPGPQRLP